MGNKLIETFINLYFGYNYMKKAQSLSLNTIIIMVLALLVLVVVIFMFGSKARIVGFTISQSCSDMGGTCATQETVNTGGNDGIGGEASTTKRWTCPEGQVIKWTSRCAECEKTSRDEDKKLCACCVSIV
jgi:hypothetical protein